MFILEFKKWIEELLIEALFPSDLFSMILNHINNPISNIVGVGKKNIKQLISSITEKIYNEQKIRIDNDAFLKSFIGTLINKSVRSKEFNSIIDPDFFKINNKQEQEREIDAAVGFITLFLEDLDEKSSIFGEILVSHNQNLAKSISDFFINPRGKHVRLGHEEKPLFKKLLAKPPSERKQNAQGGFNNDEENQYIPTYDETLPRRDASAGAAASAVKPRAEIDDEARIQQQEFQTKLLAVTIDGAKAKLNSHLKIFLDENKDTIINPANLEFFAKNPLSKTPKVNNTNNYLKIKALHDIGTKFDKKDKDGKIPIAELEGHSDNPSYGRDYSTLPDRKDFSDPDSIYSKYNDRQWISLISNYILKHYNQDKDPKIVISFFRNLYGRPSDMWNKIVDDAVAKSKNVKKDLLEKDFPLIQDDFEEDAESKKDKTDKLKFRRVWTDMSKNLALSAKSDLDIFLQDRYRSHDEDGKPKEVLPDVYHPYDEDDNPKEEGEEKGKFDVNGKAIVVKVLDDFYYNKYYGNTSASKSGVQIDDNPKKIDRKLHLFQKQLKIYRLLLGLSAIEIVKEEMPTGTIPLCKQLQIWLEASFRDPEFNISFEEYTKIKEIKKIKELLIINKNIISNVFKKPLEDICVNDKFTVEKGEDEFEIEDNDAVAKEKRKEYSAALASGYFKGSQLSFQDFLALKNSKNKEDVQAYKDLISKGEKSLKYMPSSVKKAKEEESLDIAQKIVALNKGIGDPNAIAEKIRKGVPIGSPLWHDLQKVNSRFIPPDLYTPRSKEEEEFGITRSSEIPQLPAWKPKTPEVSSPDPKEKEQMIAAAKQRAQAAADQRRAYYARNLNKDTGRIT